MCNAEIIAATCALKGIEEEVHTYKRWKDMGLSGQAWQQGAFQLHDLEICAYC